MLADPVLQAQWNPKIVSINRGRSGPARMGERFELLYRMSGREQETRVTVTDCQPLQAIVFLHAMASDARERTVEETYRIVPQGKGVKVVQSIDLGRAGIPWPIRALIWFIHSFGWDAKEPYLERLKRLIEEPLPTNEGS